MHSEEKCPSFLVKLRKMYSSIKITSIGKQWNTGDTKTLFLGGVLFIVWLIFENRLLGWIDCSIYKGVIKGYEHSTLAFFLVSCFSVIYGTYRTIKILEYRKFTPYKRLLCILFFLLMYWYSRCLGYYSYHSEYFNINLFDVISGFILVYVFIAFCSNLTEYEVILNPNKNRRKFYIDNPIQHEKDDILGFGYTAKEVFETIENTIEKDENCFSIGIIGKWGEGKSSFINLVKRNIEYKREQYIILEFNARNAKSTEDIQFEFFQMLYGELMKYDSRFCNTFSNYLRAIQVLDESKISEFIQYGHDSFFVKEDEKERINNAILRIGKKIVIIIDDVDRLLEDEIIEVFKLIGGNAQFKNVVFISAFDDVYIESVLNEKYGKGDSSFMNKYFSTLYKIPYVPNSVYIEFIKKDISKYLRENVDFVPQEEEFKDIEEVLQIESMTLRDCKQFLNLFLESYKSKYSYVEFVDFFLLTLIQYRWNVVYNGIRDSKLVSISNYWFTDIPDYNLVKVVKKVRSIIEPTNKESLEVEDVSSSKEVVDDLLVHFDSRLILIFQKLFRNVRTEKSINNRFVFDNYFQLYINEYANPKVFNELLKLTKEEKFIILDSIFSSKQEMYLADYLKEKKTEMLEDESSLLNYIDVLIYVVCRIDDNGLFSKLRLFLKDDIVKKLYEKGLINDVNVYKIKLSEKLKGEYPFYPNQFIGDILLNINERDKDINYIIDIELLLNINKSILSSYSIKVPKYNDEHLQILYNCVKYVSNDRIPKITLDIDACSIVKELIIENSRDYLDDFVRIDQSVVSCEPYCVQIFGGVEEVDVFLDESQHDEREDIKLIRNVWKMYKNNLCQYITFNSISELKLGKETLFDEYIKEFFIVNTLDFSINSFRKKFELVITRLKNFNNYSMRDVYNEFFLSNVMKEDVMELYNTVKNVEELKGTTKVILELKSKTRALVMGALCIHSLENIKELIDYLDELSIK